MGPYKQDYEIVQLKPRCVESKNSTVALVGLFYIRSARDPLPIQILNGKALIKGTVTLESIFSDCIGFTPISEALEIFRDKHTNSAYSGEVERLFRRKMNTLQPLNIG
jgi:hypothetical protein